MNYGELKGQIRDLGFSDDNEITEFGDVIVNNINRAIEEINLTVAPIVDTVTIVQTGDTDGLIYYDIAEQVKEENKVFLEFADVPVMFGDKTYKRFNDFDIENESTLVIDGNTIGKLKVFYKKAHSPITSETPDTAEIELPRKAHHLLPYLAGYYIWYEDEQVKAVNCFNRYEILRDKYLSKKEQPKMKILAGGI